MGIFLLKQRGTSKEELPEDTLPEVTASVEKEKDSEEEEFYFTEELVEEGEDLQGVVFVDYLGQLCRADRFRDKGDDHRYLTVETVKDGKELFSYPVKKNGMVLETFAVSGEEFCFLEILPNGGLQVVCVDKSGKSVQVLPMEGEWLKKEEDFVWLKYAWLLGVDQKYFYMIRAGASANESFFEIYHRDGTLFRSKKRSRADLYFVDGKGHYYILRDGILKQFDVVTEEKKYEENISLGYNYWTDTTGEHLYAVTLDGDCLSYALSNGKREEILLLFGVDTSYMLDEGYKLSSAGRDGEDLCVHVYSTSEEEQEEHYIYCYEKVMGKRPERKNTLRVEVPFETEALRRAKRRFEMVYKDTLVEFLSKYHDANSYYDNREQYQEQMKVKLSANDVGDIVEIGQVLDMYTVSKSDLFVDLNPYLKKSDIREQLNQKILKGYEQNGKLRGIPTEFTVNYYEFNQETAKKIGWTKDPEVWKWSELLSLAKKLEAEGSSEVLFSVAGDFPYQLANIVRANMPDMVDYEKKTVNLHKEWFMNLMKQLKEVNKSPNFSNDIKKNPTGELDFIGDGMLFQERRINGLFNALSVEIGIAEKKNIDLVKDIRGEKNANRFAYANQVFAVSEHSTQKERAWQFLETLLSKDSQLGCEMLPMNQRAMDRQWQAETRKNFKLEIVERFEKMHRNIVEDIDGVLVNDYVNSAVIKRLQEYLKDKISLEEALNKAEHDVMIILNE